MLPAGRRRNDIMFGIQLVIYTATRSTEFVRVVTHSPTLQKLECRQRLGLAATRIRFQSHKNPVTGQLSHIDRRAAKCTESLGGSADLAS